MRMHSDNQHCGGAQHCAAIQNETIKLERVTRCFAACAVNTHHYSCVCVCVCVRIMHYEIIAPYVWVVCVSSKVHAHYCDRHSYAHAPECDRQPKTASAMCVLMMVMPPRVPGPRNGRTNGPIACADSAPTVLPTGSIISVYSA